MITFQQKIAYFLDSLVRISEPKTCPFCGESKVNKIDQKYLVTSLLECSNCHLYFRHPYESIKSNAEFYQKKYTEKDRITTDLPSPETLKGLKDVKFKTDSNKNADRLLNLYNALLPTLQGVKVIDYGASWGYISYQFKEAGLSTQSYEISQPRAAFGNINLGLNIRTSIEELEPGVDIFFSSHVIEHVPSIPEMLKQARKLTKSGGYFIAICPNGSDTFRAAYPDAFHQVWGKVHPNLLTDKFYKHIFADSPYYIGSSPFNIDAIQKWDQKSQVVDTLNEIELLVIAKLS